MLCECDDAALFLLNFHTDLSPFFTRFFFVARFAFLSCVFRSRNECFPSALTHQGQCDPVRGEEGDGRKGDFAMAKKKRERQTGNISGCEHELSNRKARRGSDGLICVLGPFLTLSSDMSGGSREVRADDCLSYIRIIRSASSLILLLLLLHPVCPPPDLSNCLASITFFSCPFTSPVSLM